MRRLLGALAALVGVLGAGCAPRAPTAAWVVRDRIASPPEAARVCASAREAGLDHLVVQVRGRGDAYYRSALAPRAGALSGAPGGYDPLAAVLEACDGLPVVAWLNVFYVWGGAEPPADPAHVARRHPEWVLTDDTGRSVAGYGELDRALGWIEGIYADPASPGYRERFAAVVRELAGAYPVAGVHLDFVRYPGPGYGQGGPLGRAFRDAWGLDPRLLPPGLRSPDLEAWASGSMPPGDRVLATLALVWAEARAREVTALVRAVRRALDGSRPGLGLSAAVWPDPGPAYLGKGQDWRTWVAEGLVDALYPMAYFGGLERVEGQIRRASALVGPWGTRLWAGLGAYIKPPERIGPEARAALAAGASGVCLFDWGSVLDGEPGPRAYVEAVRGAPGRPPPPPAAPGPPPATPGGRALWALVERAAGGAPPAGVTGPALDRRWAELESARAGALPRVLGELGGAAVRVPPWVELRGIFRFVHPGDGQARRREQQEAVAKARERVAGGEPFGAVAREVSQGGTARLGGVLGRRYLVPGTPGLEALARAEPGDLVGPVAVDNGYWVFLVEARGPASEAPFDRAPWPVRRATLREALNRTREGRRAAARVEGR